MSKQLFTSPPLRFIGTVTVVKLFTMVYKLSDRRDESFTSKTFALSQLKHGAEVCWNARVTAVAVFTIKQLKRATAACERTLIVLRVFGAELKSIPLI